MPALEIGGESFACKPALPRWQLMKLAAAIKTGEDASYLAGLHAFITGVLEPGERERFEQFMSTYAGDDDREIDHAVGAVVAAYSGRPTEQPSGSPAGPTPDGGTSRVVSLTPTTRPGHSAAS